MPRKKKVQTNTVEEKKNKKNIMNTMVSESNEDHIILQLPINKGNIKNIIDSNINNEDPIPYDNKECYYYEDKVFNNNQELVINNNLASTPDEPSPHMENKSCCFWCIHPIDYITYGMPISYDSITNTYVCHGAFCSLECANAYNFSINSGCDKVWEINSLIQMMAKVYNLDIPIRPAPSRYLLNIFSGGKMSIDEYRKLHKTSDTSHILNLPPMVNILSGYEKINTSYIKSLSENIKKNDITQHLTPVDNKITSIFTKNKN